MKKPKMTQGFTIIEVTVVMAIILIIAGMVMGVGRKARIMAMEARAETMIAALEVAIGMYHADTSAYPDESSNATLVTDLTELPSAAGSIDGQRGPYMEFKDKDLSSSGSEVVDPWGNAYDYMIMEGYGGTKWGNTNSYNLWSHGVNDTDDSGDGNTNYGDDIYSW